MQDDTNQATHLFAWMGQAQEQQSGESNLYYTAFRLQDQVYNIGDNVCLYPETPQQPAFLGKMLAAFQGPGEVPQVKVQWYERMVTLQPQCKGVPEFERQLVLLEETDVNPLGCIQSKCSVIRARTYEEAAALSNQLVKPDEPWFFCRGVFKSSTNTFEPFQEFTDDAVLKLQGTKHDPNEGVADSEDARRGGRQQCLEECGRGRERDGLSDSVGESAGSKRARVEASAGCAAFASNGCTSAAAVDGGLVLLDSLVPGSAYGGTRMFRTEAGAVEMPGLDLMGMDSSKGRQLPGLNQQRISMTGQAGWPQVGNCKAAAVSNAVRSCLQCGVTSTPQWREGPLGPKTLCNACGVRWGRAQQKAVKKAGGNPGGRNNRPAGSAASREQAQQNGSSSNLVQFGETAAAQDASAHLDSDTQPSSDKEQRSGKATGRPVRLAAMLAASRTAEYARTGSFPEQGPVAAPSANAAAPGASAGPAANVKGSQAPGAEQLTTVKSSSMLSGFTGAGAAAADLLSCGRQLSVAELTALAEEQLALLADGSTFNMQQLGAKDASAMQQPPVQAGTAAAAAAGSHNESSHHSTDSDVDAGGEHGTPFTIMVTPAATQQGPATRRRGGMATRAVTHRGGPAGRQGWQAQAASRPMTLPPLGSMTPWSAAEEAAEQQQPQLVGTDAIDTLAPLPPVVNQTITGMARAGSTAAKRRSSTANPSTAKQEQGSVKQEQGTGAGSPAGASAGVAGVVAVAPAQHCPTAPAVAPVTTAAPSATNPTMVAIGSALSSEGSTDLKAVAERAASFVPAIQQYLPVLSRFDSVRDQLPASVVSSLLEAGASVEKAVDEAAAADAALAAVRQVFLSRSAAADKARQEAVASVGRMRTFMQQLMQQCPQLDVSALQAFDGFTIPGVCLSSDIKDTGAEAQGMGFEDEVLGLGALGFPPVSLSLGDAGGATPARGGASRRPSAADGLLVDGEEVGTPATGDGNARGTFPGTPGTLIHSGPSTSALLGLMDMDDMLLGPEPGLRDDDDLGIMDFGVPHASDLQAMLA